MGYLQPILGVIMKSIIAIVALIATCVGAFSASPDYKAFRGTGGILVTTNPPSGTVVIDGSGIVGSGGSGTNFANGTFTNAVGRVMNDLGSTTNAVIAWAEEDVYNWWPAGNASLTFSDTPSAGVEIIKRITLHATNASMTSLVLPFAGQNGETNLDIPTPPSTSTITVVWDGYTNWIETSYSGLDSTQFSSDGRAIKDGARLTNAVLYTPDGAMASGTVNGLSGVQYWRLVTPRSGSTVPSAYGSAQQPAAGTSNSLVAATSTRSAHLFCASNITTNSDIGFLGDSGATLDSSTNFMWYCKFDLTNVVDIRWSCGYGALRTSRGQVNSSIIGFDTGQGDTTWKVVTANASTLQTNDTGITVSADTVYHLKQVRGNSSIVSYVNGVAVATNTVMPDTHGATFWTAVGRNLATNTAPEQGVKGVRFYGAEGYFAY